MPSSRPPRQSSRPPGDRRGAPRLPIVLAVEYKRLNSFFAYYTRNISRGGTFIATSRPLPVGTEFVFHLKVPRMDQPLELRGRVARVVAESADGGEVQGMGIEFLGPDDAGRKEIDEVVQALMIDALGEDLYRRLMAEYGMDNSKPSGG